MGRKENDSKMHRHFRPKFADNTQVGQPQPNYIIASKSNKTSSIRCNVSRNSPARLWWFMFKNRVFIHRVHEGYVKNKWFRSNHWLGVSQLLKPVGFIHNKNYYTICVAFNLIVYDVYNFLCALWPVLCK